MAEQFLREYSLTLGKDDKTRTIDGLRIAFEVTKSIRSYPNLAKIDIYNPNSDTLDLVGKYSSVKLNAGYIGSSALIFKGVVRNFFPNKIGVDRILTLYAGDGQREWDLASVNKTYAETLTAKEIINDVLKSFLIKNTKLAIGDIQDLDNIGATKLLGETLSGASKTVMDRLANDFNLTWNIQDGIINVMEQNRPLNSSSTIIVSQDTGMIGSPTLTEIGADVTTLLNPLLLPNKAYRIESQNTEVAIAGIQFRDLRRTTAEGKYRAFEVTFTGDTHGPNWYSLARGTVINE